MITDNEFNIRTLNNSQPHPDWGGWLGFLKTCEARRWEYGVVYYGKINCNYILFPNGTLIQNFGYDGESLMNSVAEDGWEKVLAQIVAAKKAYEDALAGFATSINALTNEFSQARKRRR